MPDTVSAKVLKTRNMMYTQFMDHLPCGNISVLQDIVANKIKPKKYAYIIQDKDIDDKGQPIAPHLHLMMSFDNARSVNGIAKLLGDKPNYVEAWTGNANNGYSYLCHRTKADGDKYQYDPQNVTANFDYSAELAKTTTEVSKVTEKANAVRVSNLLDLLYTGMISKKEVEDRLSGSAYGRYRRQIDDVYAKYLLRRAEEFRREMSDQGKVLQVIWIAGIAGVGKTSLAKEYAKKISSEIFVTGSSRDPFQEYSGQHVIILDEFRENTMEYQDLLRLLDPYGADSQVMAPSRYNDKAIAAELIIITSPYNPVEYYIKKFGGNNLSKHIDNIMQLVRRISLCIGMDENEIFPMEYDETTEEYKRIPGNAKPNPYSAKNRPQPAVKRPVDLFNDMFD
ncbi:MAG: hypothetical protein LUE16_11800 [Lachnospiraceae bacterium]|nr:hypothetical protein [Lachnospiraceae bacterium]